MRFNLTLFLILYFQFISLLSYSQITVQRGYIIKNNNDTIHGKIEYLPGGLVKKVAFINDNSTQINFVKPSDIKKIIISPNLTYQTKELKGNRVFFKVLTNNTVNLFEYKSQLYISCNSDSLILLKGGKETINKDGRYYYTEINTYKHQIKECLPEAYSNVSMDNLRFNKNSIVKFITKLNNHPPTPQPSILDNKIQNLNHFGIEIGASNNNITFQGYNFAIKDLFVSYSNKSPFEPAQTQILHRTNSTQIGINYKRRIKKTDFYLFSGLILDNMQGAQIEKIGLIHSAVIAPKDGNFSMWSDTIGKVVDTYNYKLNSINLPVTLYYEATHNKIRPFMNFGLLSKYYIQKHIPLNREVYIKGELQERENINLKIPAFLWGAKMGIGLRYLINVNNSISTGLTWDLAGTNETSEVGPFGTFIKRAYLSYNF